MSYCHRPDGACSGQACWVCQPNPAPAWLTGDVHHGCGAYLNEHTRTPAGVLCCPDQVAAA